MFIKKLSLLLKNINVLERLGETDPELAGLAYDSREVDKNFAFFAFKGIHTNGHNYIEGAIANGAVAVIHSEPLGRYHKNIAYVRVENSRKALSPLAAAFYDYPSEQLKVIGVTGTDGKSTTVHLLYQLLELQGKPTGCLSTVNYKVDKLILKNLSRQSTPEANRVQQILREMADNGMEYGVLESTSHALSTVNNRLGDVIYDAAVFTNISHEHLEFHGNLRNYVDDKANLFRALDRNHKVRAHPFGVVNGDDPQHLAFIHATKQPVYSYSLKNPQADLFASDIKQDGKGMDFTLHYQDQRLPGRVNLPGLYNLENSLAAVLTVLKLLDTGPQAILPLLPQLTAVKGRMKIIRRGQPFTVIVDYAHSPGSFSKLFPTVKKQVKGRIIALFGSAGERDLGKRSKQGSIASLHSDIMVLTNEDPRGEDPMKILQDIASGCPGRSQGQDIFLIPDRAQAIKLAFSLAKTDDLVLLLGKGHESSIILREGAQEWDEEEQAIQALKSMGYDHP